MKAKKRASRICCAGIAAMVLLTACGNKSGDGGSSPSEGNSGGNGTAASSKADSEGCAVFNDFEVNYDGWVPSSKSLSLTAQEGMGADNSRGMVFSGRKSPSDSVSSIKGMYLFGGVDYTYSVMVYSDTEENFRLTLDCADANGAEKSEPLCVEKVPAGTWTELKADFTAEEKSTGFRLSIKTDSSADFRFDNVTVKPKDKDKAKRPYEKGLKDEFAGYFRVGNILNGGSIKDPGVIENVLKNYNSISCENELKPDSTLVQAKCTDDDIGVSIDSAAAIFDFCVNNNIGVRGHVLVWHSQTPVWFFKDNFKSGGEWVTPEVMDKRMESYIKNMFEIIQTQYPGLDLYAYDVVNEAISDDQTRNIIYGGAREPGDNNAENGKSAWVQVYGDNSFIEKAFIYARKYAPEGCKLYYNDYNEYWDHKRDKIYNMCKNLYEKGLLDGIGMQSHVNGDIKGFSGADAHKSAMKKFLSIGCDVQVTELDLNCEGGKFTAEQQAEKCKAMFQAALDCNNDATFEGKVTAMCIWGPNDANTWIRPENTPLLYDTSNQPKAAYNALLELIPEAEWGDGLNPVKTDRPKKEINLDKTDGDSVTAIKVKEDKPEETEQTEQAGQAETQGETISVSPNYSDSFEDGDCGWTGRGSAAVSVSSDAALEGEKSLYVTGRSAAWNGASKFLDPSLYIRGREYLFSVSAMFNDGGDTDTFYMKLQYTDGSGSQQYASVAEGEAKKGEWLLLENASYQIPEDASDMQIYVETANSTNDFYIDCARAEGEPVEETASVNESAAESVDFGGEWENTADISWIDTSKPMCAICFDDGPVGKASDCSAIRIQDAISSNGGHATFFYWGNRINKANEAEITRAQELGFEIANHTYTHPDLTKLTPEKIREEIKKSADILTGITGQEKFLIRPPYLAVNDQVRKNSGAPLITCSIDTADWNNATAQEIIDKIVSKAEDGSLKNSVVLMHETYDTTAEAMEYLAPWLKEQGWQIVTVSELFKANEQTVYNGTVYGKAG